MKNKIKKIKKNQEPYIPINEFSSFVTNEQTAFTSTEKIVSENRKKERNLNISLKILQNFRNNLDYQGYSVLDFLHMHTSLTLIQLDYFVTGIFHILNHIY